MTDRDAHSVDPRIPTYSDAAQRMIQGQFQSELPIGDPDEVGRLGEALANLGKTLDNKFQQIRNLSEITEQINKGLLLDEVLSHVYESFDPVIPYDRIGFSLLQDEGRAVQAHWARTRAKDVFLTKGFTAPMEGSSLQTIMETGQPRILNDLEAYLAEHPTSRSTELVVKEGMRSSLTCPLIAMGRPIGFMFFSSMQPNTYRDVHVEIFRQIAGQLSMIVEKSRLYQQLVDLNELKNKFLGVIVHDLRNPLNIIKGYVGLHLMGALGELPAEQGQIMKSMDRACETMINLVNDLLDISAIEAGRLVLEPETIEVVPYLQEFHDSSAILGQAKTIDVILDVPDDLGTAWFDGHRVGQVLGNLVTNALKFSFPGTQVTVSARMGAEPETIEISVADQGQGIPEQELPKLFMDFGRCSVKPTAGEKSTGLGLAICKRIVEAHGGHIWVESEIAVGSTFTFSLPTKAPEAD
ncbi:GAF domain-containing sensor histidine kinase [bacterium]|nr:GAF domain-containing sensor histidine kinase [bacterium]